MAIVHAIKNILVTAGINKDKIIVVGEGIDVNKFNSAVDSAYLRTGFAIAASDDVVVNIDMIREDKGQIYFLKQLELS
jgi:hypothetical protein